MENTILLNTIKNILGNGFDVCTQEVVKGGRTVTAIAFRQDNCSVLLYPENFEELFQAEGYEGVARAMIKTFKENPQIDFSNVTTWEYAKDHLLLCIQPVYGEEDLVTVPYLDLELYFRVDIPAVDGTYKVKRNMLDLWGITEAEVLDIAFNSGKYIKRTVQKILDDIEKFMYPTSEDIGRNTFLGTITSPDFRYGASALYHKEILKEIADIYGTDIYIFPSSIHEILFCSAEGLTIAEANQMVKETNEKEDVVFPEDKLADHAYIFRRDTMDIEYEV